MAAGLNLFIWSEPYMVHKLEEKKDFADFVHYFYFEHPEYYSAHSRCSLNIVEWKEEWREEGKKGYFLTLVL